MKRIILGLLFAASLSSAFAQSGAPVKQSGNITAGQVPWWVTSGVIGGGVSSADSPVTSFGVTNNGGSGICVNSARITAAGRNTLCFGASTTGPASISLQNYGTATPQALNIVINGITYPFPGAILPGISIGSTAIASGATRGLLYDLSGLLAITTTANSLPLINGVLDIVPPTTGGGSGLNITRNTVTTVPVSGYFDSTTIHTIGRDNFDTFEVWEAYGYNGIHIANPHLITRTANGTQALPTAVGTAPCVRDTQGTSPRDYLGTWAGTGYGTTNWHLGGAATMSFCPTELFTDTAGGGQARIGVTPNGGMNFTYPFIFDQDSSLTINRNVNSTIVPQPDIPGAPAGLRVVGANAEPAIMQVDGYGSGVTVAYIARKANGTASAPTATLNLDQIGFFAAIGRGASSYGTGSGGQLRMYATQNWTDANQGTAAAFWVTPNNTNTIVEAGRFENNGSLTINRNLSTIILPQPDVPGVNAGIRVVGANSGPAFIQTDAYSGSSAYILRRANGTATAPTPTLNGDQMGFVAAIGRGTTAYGAASGSQLRMYATQNWTDANQGSAQAFWVTPNNSTAIFEAGRFDQSGFLGVGTSTPQSLLHLNKNAKLDVAADTGSLLQVSAVDSATGEIQIDTFGAANNQFSQVVLRQAAGTAASSSAVASNAIIGVIGAKAYTSAGAYTANINSQIQFAASENQTATAQGQKVAILTTPNGTVASAIAAVFQPSGGLSIGTASDPGIGMIYTNSASFMIRSKTSYSSGAAAQTATLTNGPTAGNPTKWIPVDDNGTTRYIPAW